MKPYVLSLAAAAMIAGSAIATAQEAPLTSYVLDNGLEVVLAPDHRVPKVAVGVYYKVGGMNEPTGRSGFAHLFEHLMFEGTPAYPEFDATLTAVGWENNAWTWDNQTFYWEQGLSPALPVILSVEADRMANLGNSVTQESLDLQRDVVQNEMRENVLDEPGAAAIEAVWSGLFPKGHPYSRAVIGSIPDLDAATLDDVKAFFNVYYVPNNAILVLVGDFELDATKALVEQTFGRIPRGAQVPPLDTAETEPTRVRMSFEDAVAEPRVLSYFVGPRPQDPVNGAMLIAVEILGNEEWGVLREDLINTGIAAYTDVIWTPGVLAGRLSVEAGAAEGVTSAELEAALRESLANFVSSPLAEADVERARKTVLLDKRVLKEAIRDRAEEIAMWVGYGFSPETAIGDDPQVVGATLADVEAAVDLVIKLDDASWGIIEPGERGDYPSILKDSSGVPEPITAELRPTVELPKLQAGEPATARIPDRESATLSNGIEVVNYLTPGAPLVYVAASVTGGRTSDPAGQEGLFELAAKAAYRGAGDLDFSAFSKAAKDVGADVQSRTDDQRSALTLSVPPDALSTGVALLADAVQAPRFDEDEWDVLVTETRDELVQRESDIRDVARRKIEELIFVVEPGHPAVDRSLASLDHIGLADARSAFATLFTPATMTIFTVGGVPLAELLPALEAEFGGWHSDSPGVASRPHASAAFEPGRKVFVVQEEGASQTAIFLARPALGRTEPGHAANLAASRLFGYDFIGRLNSVIREEKGYSYGVSGDAWSQVPIDAALVVDAPVERDFTGPALAEFLAGFETLDSEPVRDDELNRTVMAYRGWLAGLAETAKGFFEDMLVAVGDGSDAEDMVARWTVMTELPLPPVQEQARALSSLENSVIVIAGDPDVILPQLTELGIEDFTVLEEVE